MYSKIPTNYKVLSNFEMVIIGYTLMHNIIYLFY